MRRKSIGGVVVALVLTPLSAVAASEPHISQVSRPGVVVYATAGASTAPTPKYEGNGYTPADIQSIYGLPPMRGAAGSGPTVTLVVAASTPIADTIESNLMDYRAQFRLPACTVANACLSFLNDLPTLLGTSINSSAWAEEAALDVDAVSAACPICKLQVVRAKSDAQNDMDAAVKAATDRGARYVSLSFGDAQEYGESSAAETAAGFKSDRDRVKNFYSAVGVAYFGSSGNASSRQATQNNGLPQSAPTVIAVGGTRVERVGRRWVHSAWTETSTTCSRMFGPVVGQQRFDTGCKGRATTDISALASPTTGLAVRSPAGWSKVGGTSLATPLVAAMVARAGGTGLRPTDLYARSTAFVDIITGTAGNANGSCPSGPRQKCTARKGWDGPTGLGTPFGLRGLGPRR